ncbi:MAG: ABC transporter permease [Gemmatimonadaceae bacterium]
MNTMLRVARYGARDLLRSRWLIAYGAFFFLATTLLLRFSDTESKALLSLVNVALLVVPLANIVFGAMYLYASREFVELLLSQPVRRTHLFAGQCLGLALPIAAASVAGIVLPLLLQRVSGASLAIGLTVAFIAAALGAVFTALAAVIAYAIEDRVRGLVVAIGAWMALAIVYDALVLMAAMQFADYPLERSMLAAMIANPIDLARVTLLTRFDVAALLGYTGAVFQRFLGGAAGLTVAAGAALLWLAVPTWIGARLFHHKDF